MRAHAKATTWHRSRPAVVTGLTSGHLGGSAAVGHAGQVHLALVLHLLGAACTLAVGVMLVVVASVLLGALLTVGGGVWLTWALRRA